MRVFHIKLGAQFRTADGALWLRLTRVPSTPFRPGGPPLPCACIEPAASGVKSVALANAGDVTDLPADTDAFPAEWVRPRSTDA